MNDMLNPYIAGAPVVEASMFFGREDVFGWIERSLEGKFVNHILVLHGQRRVGKTSVLKQIPNFLPDKYIQVFFDLQGRTGTTLDRFLWWLASEIARTLKRGHDINIPKPERKAFEDTEYLINEFLPGLRPLLREKILLLTFDEFDSLDQPEIQETISRPLIAYLRRLIEVEGLNFIFSIGSSGNKLENMQASYTDFFKSALYRKISFLTGDDSQRLITKPVEGLIEYEKRAIDRISEITSGHPYFTQLMCHELFSRCQNTGARTISAEDVEDVLDDVVERGTVNLKFVWDEASDLEKWILATLAQMNGGDNQKLSQAFTDQRVRFSDSDLTSAVIHLRDKDVITEDNLFVIHLMRLWLVANRPIERVREELEEVNPIANRFIEIGDEYRDRGDVQQAVEYYQQALNVNPGDLKAQSNIGSVYLEQKNFEGAAQAFEEALKIDNEDVVAKTGYCESNLALGNQARAIKDYEEATNYYRRVLEINPNHTDAKERLEEIQKIICDYEEAQQAIREKRYERAVELLQGIIVVDPTYKASTRLLTEAVEARKIVSPREVKWMLPATVALAFVLLGIFLGPGLWKSISTSLQKTPDNPEATELVSVVGATPTVDPEQAFAQTFAEPALAYIAAATPDFQDDFSTDNHTWHGVPKDPMIEAGVMRIYGGNDSGENTRVTNDYLDGVSRYVLKVEVSRPGTCCVQIEVGEYSFYRGPGNWGICSPTWSDCSGGGPDNSNSSEIIVIKQDNQLSFYRNGNPVAYFDDPALDIAPVTFNVGRYGVFDNVKFWNLDGVDSPAEINTPTPEPAAAFYEPIFSYIESEIPTFEDDFSTAKSEWGKNSEGNNVPSTLQDGHLLVTKKEIADLKFPLNGLFNAKDFVLLISTSNDVEGRLIRGMNFVFRSNEAEDTYYKASILNDWTLVGVNPAGNQQFRTISDRVKIENELLDPPIGFNSHLFIVKDQNIAVFANGENVIYSNELFSSGVDNFLFGSGDKDTSVLIDTLKFWNLDGVEFKTTSPAATTTETVGQENTEICSLAKSTYLYRTPEASDRNRVGVILGRLSMGSPVFITRSEHGSDGKIWYYITVDEPIGSAISGYITADYLSSACVLPATPTITPIPAWVSDFVEPMLERITNVNPDFTEDFTNPKRGWEMIVGADGSFLIEDGVARVNVKKEEQSHFMNETVNSLADRDFIMEMDARIVEGKAALDLWTHFIYNENPSDSKNVGFLAQPSESTWSVTIDSAQGRNSQEGKGIISPVGQYTHITIILTDQKVAFSLNGNPVAYFEGPFLDEPGGFHFNCDGQSTGGVCEFDNIKVWELPK